MLVSCTKIQTVKYSEKGWLLISTLDDLYFAYSFQNLTETIILLKKKKGVPCLFINQKFPTLVSTKNFLLAKPKEGKYERGRTELRFRSKCCDQTERLFYMYDEISFDIVRNMYIIIREQKYTRYWKKGIMRLILGTL